MRVLRMQQAGNLRQIFRTLRDAVPHNWEPVASNLPSSGNARGASRQARVHVESTHGTCRLQILNADHEYGPCSSFLLMFPLSGNVEHKGKGRKSRTLPQPRSVTFYHPVLTTRTGDNQCLCATATGCHVPNVCT